MKEERKRAASTDPESSTPLLSTSQEFRQSLGPLHVHSTGFEGFFSAAPWLDLDFKSFYEEVKHTFISVLLMLKRSSSSVKNQKLVGLISFKKNRMSRKTE